MKVRFTDPQPGRFLVGSSDGVFVFTNGFHDSVPDHIVDEWAASGAAIEIVPEEPAPAPPAEPVEAESAAPEGIAKTPRKPSSSKSQGSKTLSKTPRVASGSQR